MLIKKIINAIEILLIVIMLIDPIYAQMKISSDLFLHKNNYELDLNWKYSQTDSTFNYVKDSTSDSWAYSASTIFNNNNPLKYTHNKVWFYCELLIDTSLYGKSIGFNVFFLNDVKVYLNDNIIFDRNFNDGKAVLPINAYFTNDSVQVLKVELSTEKIEYFIAEEINYGFIISLVNYEEYLHTRVSALTDLSIQKVIFIVISLVLAVFHTFLYIFNRKKLNNIFYVLFLVFFALFIAGNYNSYYSGNAEILLLYMHVFKAVLIFVILTGSTALYTINKPLPKYYPYIWIYSIILGMAGYFSNSSILLFLTYASITAISMWGSWHLFGPKKYRSFEEKIIKSGFAVMASSGILQMLYSLNFLTPIFGISDIYVYGVIFFMFTMSLAFAYDFASTSKNLEKKLEEVKILSEKAIEQERRASEQEIEKKLLAADNKRKTKELEEARNLQLSMLPSCLNDIPGLDICFGMKTATEVGGDYYDYYFSNDGTLNIAIGDATGHGTKAGLMVATIKSLFNALGAKMMIPDFFNRCTEIIKTMNLGNLFMSMTIIRYKNKRLIVSAAGMPPVLIYNKSENRIDKILIKGMPLGGFRDFKYYEEEYELEGGDVILMMTDGLPELFNEEKIMYGDNKIKELLLKHNEKTATEINRELFNAADEWRGNRPQDDDMTFVIIKIK